MNKHAESNGERCSKSLETALCCGCAACSIVCPTNAIEMQFQNGSYRPKVDYSICVSCGLCVSGCQALQGDSFSGGNPLSEADCYVGVVKDKDVLGRSSSGGIGYTLGQIAVEAGVPYCGASYVVKHERCEHIVCDRDDQLAATQGSKYLASACGPTFSEVVRRGKGLVVGTPCQIAGLDEVLRRRGTRGNYTLVDIFCHGVPNELLWERHLDWLKDKRGVRAQAKVTFRKNQNYLLTIDKYEAWYNEDAFFTIYLRGWMYNRACYSCRYRRNSHADIRIGDLMVPKYKSLPYSPSCILALTEHGKEVLRNASDRLELYDEPFATIDGIQEASSASMPKGYDQMLSSLSAGIVPEQLVKRTICIGRVKSFVKHVLLAPLFKSGTARLADLAGSRYGE